MVEKTQYKLTKKQLAVSLILIIIISVVQIGTKYHMDYVILSPGTADPVGQTIHIEGVKSFQPKGTIRFLTVLVTVNRPTLFEYLKAKYLEDDNELVEWDLLRGDESSEEEQTANEMAMTGSQNAAKVVALSELGCDVKKTGEGAYITQVELESAADKAGIKANSIIVAIDTQKVSTDEDAVAILSSHKPGDQIVLSLKQDGKDEISDISVTLGENPNKPGTGFLGVGLSTSLVNFDYPIKIDIEQGDVSGPSAGLAFTISIIDQLTKGELTGGNDYAVTGEIAIDGSVNPVGGVAQKAVAAKNAGAKFMIVPKGEAKDAKSTAGKMKIFEVENIDQALDVLASNGGDPLPQLRACPNS